MGCAEGVVFVEQVDGCVDGDTAEEDEGCEASLVEVYACEVEY